MIARILPILLSLLLLACGPEAVPKVEKSPKGLIPLDSMVLLMTEIHVIEGARIGEKLMGDSLSVEDYYRMIWAKYGVGEERYQKSFTYYSRHPELMDEIYTKTIERLNRQSVDFIEKKAVRD